MVDHLKPISRNNKVRDKRLHVDLSSIAEMVDGDNVQVTWVDRSQQLVNVLNKKGEGFKQILEVVRTGSLETLKLPS